MRNGRSYRVGIGRAAPRNMPRFSPRGYANGGLADTVGMTGMTGMAGMAAPVDMSMEFEEEITPVGDVVSEDVFVGDNEYGQRVMELKEALYSGGPEGDTVIRAFVEDFGEEALLNVIDEMSSGEIAGPGDGMSDQVPAVVDGVEEVNLSSGEYVVPADAVSGIGNGSSEAGARELMDMVERVRGARTGTTGQPPQVNPGRMLPS